MTLLAGALTLAGCGVPKEEHQKVVEALRKQTYVVGQVDEKEQKRYPKPPFTTSTLQQEAFHKLGYSSARTMRIAQQLYEGIELGQAGPVGLITYMRTDAVRVAQEETVRRSRAMSAALEIPAPPGLAYLPIQKAGIAYALDRPATLLADEMGLYTGDLDRMGMLSFDAWRASRLVVDTGIHARGWTRKQAIDFMLANTALAENNIENEVDRYIAWPGQALAYKLGQIEITRLRSEAQARPGGRFDLRAFHDRIVSFGSM
jgi:hypothetical protein